MKEIDEQAMRITEEQIKYYKLLKEPSELEEIPIDILRGLYSDLLLNTEDIKKEHAMMVKFIKENGLWNKFLNSDDFIDHLNTSPLFVSGKDEKDELRVQWLNYKPQIEKRNPNLFYYDIRDTSDGYIIEKNVLINYIGSLVTNIDILKDKGFMMLNDLETMNYRTVNNMHTEVNDERNTRIKKITIGEC